MEFLSRVKNWIRENPILAVIIAAGFLLRFTGIRPGYFAHGDEVMYGSATRMLLQRTLETNALGYPSFVPWIMLVSFLLLFIPLTWIGYLITHFQDIVLVLGGVSQNVDAGMIGLTRIFYQDILARNWINAMYWARYLTAIFGTGMVFLAYKLVLTYFKKRGVALLASLFVALNYRLVLSSHLSLPDTYNAFFFLLALWSIGLLLDKPTFKRYLFAWLSTAFSFLVKYQFYALVPLFIAHTVVSLRGPHKSAVLFVRTYFRREMVIGGLVALSIVFTFHAYHFLQWEEVLAINKYEALKYGFGRNILNIFPISYLYHVGIGPQLSLFAIGGGVVGLIRRNYRMPTLLLVSTLPIFAFLYLYYTVGGFFTRNFLAAMPILLILAALFVNEVWESIWPRRKNIIFRSLVLIIFAIALTLSLKDHVVNSLISSGTYAEESPRVKAQKWVEDNISGEVVFGTYHGNPTPADPAVKVRNLTPPGEAFSYRELLEEGFDYAVIDFSVVHDTFLWWMNQSTKLGLKFWDKPDDLLSQTFMALATRELLWSHGMKAFLTPWQAPGYNYAIVKIGEEVEYAGFNSIQKYDFETSDSWIPLYFLPQFKEQLWREKDETDNYSLVIKPGFSLPGGIRWESPFLKAKSGYGYKVTGWIKNQERLEKTERSGFLRLDFYEEREGDSVTSRSLISFVSERIYGENDWHKVEIQAVAPRQTDFLKVSFQARSSFVSFYLDNVEIMEAEEEITDLDEDHLIIPDKDFFLPNNNGFL